MSGDEVQTGRLVGTIVTVLAVTLLLSLAGLVVLGLVGGDPVTRDTLTHVIETVTGVFIGIAAGRLASDS